MRARLALLVGFVVVVSLLGSVTQQADRPGVALQSDSATRPAYDRGDRQAVIDAFYDTWLRNQKVPLGWTGSVSGCKPGQVSDAARAATLGQINYFDPPDSWACRTDAADRLAGRANLALGSAARGAGAISLYITDSSHVYAGHRRWLPWPSAGYFPSPLEPSGRWSLSASNPKTDFAKASVTVTDASGHRYSVHKHPVGNGFGPRTQELVATPGTWYPRTAT